MVLILLLSGWIGFTSSVSRADTMIVATDSLEVETIMKPIKVAKPDIRDSVVDTMATMVSRPEPSTPVIVRREPAPEPVVSVEIDIVPDVQPDLSVQATVDVAEQDSIDIGYVIGAVVLIAMLGVFLIRKRRSTMSTPIVADEPILKPNDTIPLDIGGMKVRLGQAQHLGMRRQQQDAFALSDPAISPFIAVVADGMGGMKNGAEASKLAIREFMGAMATKTDAVSAVEAANNAVFQLGKDAGEEEGTGTTLVAILLQNQSMHWISVGDSQIYLLRNGELAKVNTEHSYVLDLYQDVIRQQSDLIDARRHPEKDALTSFIGLKDLARIDHSRNAFPLKQDDAILMCSDGLYRSLTDSEIIGILSGATPNPADELVKRAMAKNHPYQDNTTVITLQIEATS